MSRRFGLGVLMNVFSRYFRPFGVLAAVGAALCAAPAPAAVLYEFSIDGGTFSLTSPQYITVDTFVTAANLDSCTASGVPCEHVRFDVDYYGDETRSVIAFAREFIAGGYFTTYHYFDFGVFAQNGTYGTVTTYNPATLRVSGAADPVGAVPEPATWALLILGFGLIGGTMRSARRDRGASGELPVRSSSAGSLASAVS